jgi:hypothetical protein
MKHCVRLFLLLAGIFGGVQAQEIKSVHAEARGEVVYIDYVLEQSESIEAYRVSLYGIIDSFTVQLEKVSGDVGDQVNAGTNRIVWDAISEYPRFDGEIEFEVRVIPAFFILKPGPNLVLKRGTSYAFEWYGAGSNADSLRLDLLHEKEYKDRIGNVLNANTYRWDIPVKTKPGSNFQLKVTGTPKTGITGVSPTFTIKRKIPLMLKVGPIVALGALSAILLWPEPEPEPLPPPCDPSDPTCQ